MQKWPCTERDTKETMRTTAKSLPGPKAGLGAERGRRQPPADPKVTARGQEEQPRSGDEGPGRCSAPPPGADSSTDNQPRWPSAKATEHPRAPAPAPPALALSPNQSRRLAHEHVPVAGAGGRSSRENVPLATAHAFQENRSLHCTQESLPVADQSSAGRTNPPPTAAICTQDSGRRPSQAGPLG